MKSRKSNTTAAAQKAKDNVWIKFEYLGKYSNEAALPDKQQIFYFSLFSDKVTTPLEWQIHPNL